jgi:signal transduction histidine kinase
MATVIVVLAIGAVGLIKYFERKQVAQVDASLAAAVRFVQRTSASNTQFPKDSAEDSLVQIVNADDHVVFASQKLRGAPAMRSADGVRTPTSPKTVSVTRVGSVRVVVVPFRGSWLLYASSLKTVDDAVSSLTTALLVGLPLLAAVLAVVLWIVVGTTLRPVRRAVEREDRLVGDVSHELRSPLAGIRALLESESQIPAEIELNRLEALAVLARLESIADGLLTEARNDGADELRFAELVDLDEVALHVAAMLSNPPTPITLDVSAVSGGQVRGNEGDLERMIANLVSNAMRHARSLVEVRVTEHDDIVTLTVADDGPGIAAIDRERIYERFTRLDDARSRDGGGVGLGLAIVQSVVAAHGGTISTRDADIGGAAFVVTLPASVRGAGDPERAASGKRGA